MDSGELVSNTDYWGFLELLAFYFWALCDLLFGVAGCLLVFSMISFTAMYPKFVVGPNVEPFHLHRKPVGDSFDSLAEPHEVNPMDLVVEVRSSKRLEEYTQSTRTDAVLERSEATGIGQEPGQPVEYVVLDDSKSDRERVQLPHEKIDGYDAEFYATEFVRAAKSVLSPVGWREDDIREYLADRAASSIGAF